MYKAVDVIEVRIWGRRVGAVALDPGLGNYVFEYEPEFGQSLWNCHVRLPPAGGEWPRSLHDAALRPGWKQKTSSSDSLCHVAS